MATLYFNKGYDEYTLEAIRHWMDGALKRDKKTKEWVIQFSRLFAPLGKGQGYYHIQTEPEPDVYKLLLELETPDAYMQLMETSEGDYYLFSNRETIYTLKTVRPMLHMTAFYELVGKPEPFFYSAFLDTYDYKKKYPFSYYPPFLMFTTPECDIMNHCKKQLLLNITCRGYPAQLYADLDHSGPEQRFWIVIPDEEPNYLFLKREIALICLHAANTFIFCHEPDPFGPYDVNIK